MAKRKIRQKTVKQLAKERELLMRQAVRGVVKDHAITFSAALRTIRKAFDFTQQDVAERLGLSKAAIAQWEVNLALPRQSFLGEIESMFSMKPKSLFHAFENSMVQRVLSSQ